jgi:hypothetical protein
MENGSVQLTGFLKGVHFEPNYWLADTSCPKFPEIKGLLWK